MRRSSDPHAELGIPRDATQAEITHAFRQLLRRHHPDTRSTDGAASRADSDAALQRVIAAYAALSGDRSVTPDRAAFPTRQPSPVTRRSTQTQTQPVTGDAIRAGPIRWERTRT